MDLQYLDGIEGAQTAYAGIDARDLFSQSNEIGELGKLLKRRANGGGGSTSAPPKKGLFQKKTPEQKQLKKQTRQQNKKKTLKVVNKINKVNPATVLLRAGILASMKLNLLKVAERLKWGYATREYAEAKGMDMSKYDKLKTVLRKAESIFYAAGGKPENLKKAILTGKGNANHEVQGVQNTSTYNTVRELLGALYESEFVQGLEGFGQLGQLGEPSTAAAVTAASGAMGALAALLASIGNLFPRRNNRQPGRPAEESSSDNQTSPSEQTDADPLPEEQTEQASDPVQDQAEESEGSDSSTDENTRLTPPSQEENNEVAPGSETEDPAGEQAPTQPEGTDGVPAGPVRGIAALWAKHKTWLAPVGIGVGVLAIAGIISYATTSKENKQQQRKYQPALNGPHRKRKKWKGGNGRYGRKTVMALQ